MWRAAELNQEYVDKMEDVLATYEKPYNPTEPVVCLDEKPISLHADLRPPTPATPGLQAPRLHVSGRYGEHHTNEGVPDTEENGRTYPRLTRCFAHVCGLILVYADRLNRRGWRQETGTPMDCDADKFAL